MYSVSGGLSSWKVLFRCSKKKYCEQEQQLTTGNKKPTQNMIINKMKNLYLHLRECAFFPVSLKSECCVSMYPEPKKATTTKKARRKIIKKDASQTFHPFCLLPYIINIKFAKPTTLHYPHPQHDRMLVEFLFLRKCLEISFF